MDQALFSSTLDQCNSIKLEWVKATCNRLVISQKENKCRRFETNQDEINKCLEEVKRLTPTEKFSFQHLFFTVGNFLFIILLTLLQSKAYQLYKNNSSSIFNVLDSIGDFLDHCSGISKKIGIPKKIFDYILFVLIGSFILFLFSLVVPYGPGLR
jgi:hypothetical protein